MRQNAFTRIKGLNKLFIALKSQLCPVCRPISPDLEAQSQLAVRSERWLAAPF